MTSYLDTRLGSLPRTGSFVQSLGSFNTLAELNATHPANNYNPGTTAYTIDQGLMVSDGAVWESPGMVPGEEDVTAATYAAARLLSGAATGARLQVRGRTSQSDGGQGLFTWVAGGTTLVDDGFTLTAPGGIWQRDEKVIRVEMFGAVGNGVADDAASLNNAIQAAIIYGVPCYLKPGKTYSIASPMICGYFQAGVWAFNNLTFGTPQVAALVPGANIQSAKIVPTFNDRPALCIQNARSHNYFGFEINGLNEISSLHANATGMVNSNYVVAGCRDSRYSPYAGICIDPFSPALPPDGGYPGMSAYYVASVAASSGSTFTQVSISRFVVGIMIVPNGTTLGAENFSFYDCQMYFNKVGFAIGQAQSRECNVHAMSINTALYCYDGLLYGQQQGYPPNITGANLSGKFLFHFSPSFGDATTINNIHAESFASIGYISPNTVSQQPVTFRSCEFIVSNTGTVYADYHLFCTAPVLFEGCTFENNAGPALRFRCTRGARFLNCYLKAQSTNNELQLAPSTSGSLGLQWDEFYFDNVYVADQRGNASAGSYLSMHKNVNGLSTIDGAYIPLGGLVKINGIGQVGPTSSLYFNGSTAFDNQIDLGSVTVTIVGDGTATFTAGDVTIIRLGDLIYTSTSTLLEALDGTVSFADTWFCLGAVSSIVSTTVTINGLPQNAITTGTFHLYAVGLMRVHQNSVGDLAASTTVSNVTNPTTWKIGDRIKGIGIATGTVVSNVSGSTVTLSKAATTTATAMRLYDADLRLISAPAAIVAVPQGTTGTAPAPNCTNGMVQAWSMNNNVTWGVPTNTAQTQVGLTLTLIVTSTGAFTTAWNAIYRNPPAWAAAANGQKATAVFMWDGVSWQFIGGSAAFA